MAQITDMQGLMVHDLQELYSAETQAAAAYPQIIQAADAPEVQQTLQQHAQQTQQQIQRLEKLAQQMGISPQGDQNMAIQGLISDAQKLEQEIARGPVLDAALIGAAQKIEHFEIASYGTARTLAQQAGQNQAAQVFQQILDEEKQADSMMNDVAMNDVNRMAAAA